MSQKNFAGFTEASPEMVAMMKAAYASPDGYARLAKALSLPLQSAVLKGDILQDIFETIQYAPGVSIEYPIDFLNNGEDKNFVAFTLPAAGAIPHRHVDGDYVMVPTYEDGNAIDCNKKYLRDARWDIMDRMMETLVNGHVVKMNRDGWRTILAAGANRGIAVYDSEAAAGYFSKRLVSLMRTAFVRYGGGNSTSLNRFRMTDMYQSPENLEDIRNWDLTQVDDGTRRQIFLGGASDGEYALSTIYGVRLHDLFELGVGQEFQNYYTGTLGSSMVGSKVEIVVGLDLSKRRSFVNPVREPVTVQEDTTVARQRRFSLWSHWEGGWGVLDDRAIVIGQV